MSLKEQAISTGKRFIAETALEFNHEAAISAIKELFKDITPEILKRHVQAGKPLNVEGSVLEWLFSRRNFIAEYSAKSLAARFAELLSEAKPDLVDTLASIGDEGSIWFYRSIEMIRDMVTNPSRYMEEVERPQTISVTCDSCGKSMRIFKDDVESLSRCPFCGASKEE